MFRAFRRQMSRSRCLAGKPSSRTAAIGPIQPPCLAMIALRAIKHDSVSCTSQSQNTDRQSDTSTPPPLLGPYHSAGSKSESWQSECLSVIEDTDCCEPANGSAGSVVAHAKDFRDFRPGQSRLLRTQKVNAVISRIHSRGDHFVMSRNAWLAQDTLSWVEMKSACGLGRQLTFPVNRHVTEETTL